MMYLGQQINEWTVLAAVKTPKYEDKKWTCACSCGTIRDVLQYNLLNNDSTCCGCKKTYKKLFSPNRRKMPEYTIWRNMKARCYNTNNVHYKNYGGRGISVANEWKNSFENFISDMGLRPNEEFSLDRTDVDLSYSKDNCRWATKDVQMRNMTTNVKLSYANETRCLSEWAEFLGLKYITLYQRIFKLGWPIEKAFSTPARKMRRNGS
jgi:hypothetical protein